MIFKIFTLLLVACATQLAFGKKLTSKDLPEGFQQIYENRDNFGKSVTLSVVQSHLQNKGNQVNVCYWTYQAEYSLLVRTFTLLANQAAKEFIQYFGKTKYAHYGRRFQGPLRAMADKMTNFLFKFGNFLKKGQFDDAKKLMEETRSNIELYDALILALLKKLENHSPKYANQIDERYQQIRKEAKNSAESMSEMLIVCVTKSE